MLHWLIYRKDTEPHAEFYLFGIIPMDFDTGSRLYHRNERPMVFTSTGIYQ